MLGDTANTAGLWNPTDALLFLREAGANAFDGFRIVLTKQTACRNTARYFTETEQGPLPDSTTDSTVLEALFEAIQVDYCYNE